MSALPWKNLRRLLMMVLLVTLAACASTPKGAYVSPVDGVVSSGFGPRGGSVHKGVDIAAPRGTEVRAVQAGRVIFRGRRKGFGRLLIIDHGGGVESYYAHLSGYNVRKGNKVKRGQKIGRVGNSGRSKGYHLHFELRMDGRPVNPAGVVPF